MSTPSGVLSEALERAIGGRKVRVAVFASYQFDPGFFELHIVPLLFNRGFSHTDGVKLVQLDDAVRELDHLAVYYDRTGLKLEETSAHLDYRRFAVHRKTGLFHPKMGLILVDDGDSQSLLVLVGSANLTRSGWWKNVEVAHITELTAEKASPLRQDLLGADGLFESLRAHDGTGQRHEALGVIQRYVEDTVTEGDGLPRLYVGKEDFPDFCAAHAPQAMDSLELLAPYFDDTAEAGPVSRMVAKLLPRRTTVLLPVDNEMAACSPDLLKAVSAMPGVSWGKLPSDATAWKKGDARAGHRFVHAKVVLMRAPTKEVCIAGSVNLTNPAFTSAKAGNFEVSIATRRDGRHQAWLTPLDSLPPTRLPNHDDEDRADPDAVPPLTLRYNWATETLDAFWGGASQTEVQTKVNGVPLFSLSNPSPGEWTVLGLEAKRALLKHLPRTSYVEVEADDRRGGILVQEDGMAHKPSLLLHLNPTEILEYWSLLSQVQRDAFINKRVLTAISMQDEFTARPSSAEDTAAPTSMFDRFAGVFHAFSCLQEFVVDAIEQERTKDAVYRLFGKKHDSLPSLIDKVLAKDAEGDLVTRYVTLLNARELVQNVRREHPEFAATHAPDFGDLDDQIGRVEELRASFDWGDASDREAFLTWFEGWFAQEVT
jgi:hypothetical protein